MQAPHSENIYGFPLEAVTELGLPCLMTFTKPIVNSKVSAFVVSWAAVSVYRLRYVPDLTAPCPSLPLWSGQCAKTAELPPGIDHWHLNKTVT